MKNNLLVLAGAIIGGIVGHFAFFWIAQHGLYALVVPGGLVGLGAGIFKTKSIPVAVCCGALALVAGVASDCRFERFPSDDSLSFYLTHLYQLPVLTLIMLIAGTGIGFWVPFRRRGD